MRCMVDRHTARLHGNGRPHLAQLLPQRDLPHMFRHTDFWHRALQHRVARVDARGKSRGLCTALCGLSQWRCDAARPSKLNQRHRPISADLCCKALKWLLSHKTAHHPAPAYQRRKPSAQMFFGCMAAAMQGGCPHKGRAAGNPTGHPRNETS